MPAKKKVTRAAMLQAAVEILRKEGNDHLNARSVAQKLGCSTQPIYTEFGSMEALKAEMKREAERLYVQAVAHYTAQSKYPPYMAFGLGFIRFAKQEKEMFRYLYMRDRHGNGRAIDDINAPNIMQTLTQRYNMAADQAKQLHYDMMIYAYGLAVMVNANYLDIDEDEICRRLRLEFVALARVYGAQEDALAAEDSKMGKV